MKKFLLSIFVLFVSCSTFLEPAESRFLKSAEAVGRISSSLGTGTCFFVIYRNVRFIVTAGHLVKGDVKYVGSTEEKIIKFRVSDKFDVAGAVFPDIQFLDVIEKNTYLRLCQHVYPLYDEIYSIGNPYTTTKLFFFGRLTHLDEYNEGWISLPAMPGSSGSPVISCKTGEVYGMTIQIPSDFIGHYPIIQKMVTAREISSFLDSILDS